MTSTRVNAAANAIREAAGATAGRVPMAGVDDVVGVMPSRGGRTLRRAVGGGAAVAAIAGTGAYFALREHVAIKTNGGFNLRGASNAEQVMDLIEERVSVDDSEVSLATAAACFLTQTGRGYDLAVRLIAPYEGTAIVAEFAGRAGMSRRDAAIYLLTAHASRLGVGARHFLEAGNALGICGSPWSRAFSEFMSKGTMPDDSVADEYKSGGGPAAFVRDLFDVALTEAAALGAAWASYGISILATAFSKELAARGALEIPVPKQLDVDGSWLMAVSSAERELKRFRDDAIARRPEAVETIGNTARDRVSLIRKEWLGALTMDGDRVILVAALMNEAGHPMSWTDANSLRRPVTQRTAGGAEITLGYMPGRS